MNSTGIGPINETTYSNQCMDVVFLPLTLDDDDFGDSQYLLTYLIDNRVEEPNPQKTKVETIIYVFCLLLCGACHCGFLVNMTL